MTTTILGLPELESAQNQKYLTVNQALQRLDVLVNLTVFNRTVTAPPGSPSAGHRYIVASPATGAFAGQENNIAAYIGSNWIFFTPSEGWRAYDQGANQFIVFNGSAWVVNGLSSGALSDGSVTLLGVGATPDTTNRLSVESPGVLFDAETDDFALTLNKAGSPNTLQVLMQTGFSTRAQFGLLSNDDLAFQVSPDGSAFHLALTIDKDTGNVAIGAGSDGTNKLLVSGSNMLFTNSGNLAFTFNKGASGDDCSLTFQSGFSARALVGLLGDDDFTFKVTPDGSTYKTGMIIDKDTAAVNFAEHPKFSVYCNFGQDYTAGGWVDYTANIARHNDQADVVITSNVPTFTAPHDGYYMFGYGGVIEHFGTAPTALRIGLSVNTAAPEEDTWGVIGDAAMVSGETQVRGTACLKLSAGDDVKLQVFAVTNNGRFLADANYWWGAQIA